MRVVGLPLLLAVALVPHAPGADVGAPATVPAAAKSPDDEPEALGSVAGTVRHVGSTPLRIKVLTNTVDVATCGDTVRSDALLEGPSGAIANVVVEVRRADGSLLPGPPLPPAPAPVLVDLASCGHRPHVAVVPVGSRLEIANSDRLAHDLTTWTVRNEAVSCLVARFRRRVVLSAEYFAAPERIRVSCGRHPWMIGWWIVTDNPHLTVTGPDGRFLLDGLPPGRYTLTAWHEQLGTLTQAVEIPSGAAAQTVSLEYH